MNPMYNSFKKDADRQVIDPSNRGKIIAAALAKALADLQHLPSSQVESPSNYFNTQVLPGIRVIISHWNENMVFDARSCVDHVRVFWMMRYTAAHPITRPIYSLERSFFECIFGVNTFVAPDTAVFLEANKQSILYLATCAAIIVDKQMKQEADV